MIDQHQFTFLIGGMKCPCPVMWNHSANSYPWILPTFIQKKRPGKNVCYGLSIQKIWTKFYW